MIGLFVLGFGGLATMIGVAYANTPTPDEPTVKGVQDQASIFYYSDGKTEIGRIGKKRQSVELNEVARIAQDAALAAENRNFRNDPGFSVKGTARAVWVNLTGGRGGGSTITQQLAKNYYSDPNNRTYSRKFKELLISLKLADDKSKDEILKLYLNTIYWGRDTYGIEAASREYFGAKVHANNLRPDQAAFLGGIIQNPNRDPSDKENQAWVMERYQYTLKGLVAMKALSQADADKYMNKLPKYNKPGAAGDLYDGQRGYMLMRAKLELKRQGIGSDVLTTKGLRVYTTFDRRKMKAATEAAERTVPQVHPKTLARKKIRVGLVSVDSKNGEVIAFYGGPGYLDQAFDNVWQGRAQAGSAMKPYVLAAALKKGYSLDSMVEGRSRIPIRRDGSVGPGGYPVPNGHRTPAAINLVEAMKLSINTAFVQLGGKVGADDVIRLATDAGISSELLAPHKDSQALFLGVNDIRPIEQAAGYAMFANGGTYHQPHVIREVRKTDDKTRIKLKNRWESKSVLSENQAANATKAMRAVVTGGTATAAALPDREVAGKTGTTDRNVATWFVGYIPQVSTAVTLYNDDIDKQTKLKKSLILPGIGEVQGGTIPARIWRQYMLEATRGMTPESFPVAQPEGTAQIWAKLPKKKEKDDKEKDKDKRPPWCDSPVGELDPRCKDGGDGGDNGDQNPNKPCQLPGQTNCNPDRPPSYPPPRWWCMMHRDEKACRKVRGQDDAPWPNSRRSVELPLISARTERD
ncbi:transglycosylase domain-containing protein [Actinomadura macrotermitis]|uniref:Monofunctional biosynthetic peptidoglycan transglycosylase n=1 Tax=Actinomadura macrotermitis TaxID=2585200 RepID=A0A7K0BVV2_9ACTN|nr:transglycosylase domain-containing protein [Actinomadura macrotermitis]MQY05310.1 Monofunctional biosynthetic peptidoglycan transglycosylase [Actinomadura macrotermitis]